jgi:hypothetical protein
MMLLRIRLMDRDVVSQYLIAWAHLPQAHLPYTNGFQQDLTPNRVFC